MDRRVLVIGASGCVGSALMDVLWNKPNYDTVGTCYLNPRDGMISLEMEHPQSIRDVISKVMPNVIYVPAYVSNVDKCETDGFARKINVDGIKWIVDEAKRINATVVFFSSGYVFSGNQILPYSVWDKPSPLQQYGIQKLIAENVVLSSDYRNVVVRISATYGKEDRRKNFACQVLDSLLQKKEIKVSSKQRLNPIHADVLADATVQMVSSGFAGLLHIGGSECVTKYEWAFDIAKRFGLDDTLVVPVEDFSTVAKRPVNGCLQNNCSVNSDYNSDLDRFYEAE